MARMSKICSGVSGSASGTLFGGWGLSSGCTFGEASESTVFSRASERIRTCGLFVLAHTSSERFFQVVGLDPGSSAQTERLCQNKCGNMDAVMTPPGSGPMFGNRPETPTSHLREGSMVPKYYILWPQSTYIGTDYCKAKVYTIWAHGPLRLSKGDALDQIRYYDPGLGGIPYFGVLGYLAGLDDA